MFLAHARRHRNRGRILAKAVFTRARRYLRSARPDHRFRLGGTMSSHRGAVVAAVLGVLALASAACRTEASRPVDEPLRLDGASGGDGGAAANGAGGAGGARRDGAA